MSELVSEIREHGEYNARLVNAVVAFAFSLAPPDEALDPKPREAFVVLAELIGEGVQLYELTREQAFGRLIVFADLGTKMAFSHGVDDASWFEDLKYAYDAALGAEQPTVPAHR